ncbi:MAG TPA: hypothetical protein VGT04_14620 [Acidobacteriaceae bacterium]|nr:hypothetical protein [Acidobacteriaceae bacterium]
MEQATGVFPLCSHTKPDGSRCDGAALKGMNFCFQHIGGRLSDLRAASAYSPKLDLVPAATREALQHNFSVVALAFSDGKIDIRTANTYFRIYRTAEQNLTRWERANKDNPEKQMLPLSNKASEKQASTAGNEGLLSEESAGNEVETPVRQDANSAADSEDQDFTGDRYEVSKDKTLFVGMTHKYPSVEYTYELWDRIQKRTAEFDARKQARELAKAQVAS